jgi:hypothetical protein
MQMVPKALAIDGKLSVTLEELLAASHKPTTD